MGKIGNRNEPLGVIADYIYNCVVGSSKGTHRIDWIDAEIYGCIEKTDLFKSGKRLFKVRMSEAAYEYWKNNQSILGHNLDRLPHSKAKGLSEWFHNEHVMPRVYMRRAIIAKFKDDPNNFTPEWVREFIEKCGRGAIILDSEAKALDRTYLKTGMPKGWDYETNYSEPWCRLEEVGIKLRDEYYAVLDI